MYPVQINLANKRHILSNYSCHIVVCKWRGSDSSSVLKGHASWIYIRVRYWGQSKDSTVMKSLHGKSLCYLVLCSLYLWCILSWRAGQRELQYQVVWLFLCCKSLFSITFFYIWNVCCHSFLTNGFQRENERVDLSSRDKLVFNNFVKTCWFGDL